MSVVGGIVIIAIALDFVAHAIVKHDVYAVVERAEEIENSIMGAFENLFDRIK